jgi:hypothetical protein
MKQILIFCIVIFAFAKLYGLNYVESSNGLQIPALDGGRTELEFADIDNDGNVDILSIGDHGSPYVNTDEHGIMVWFGNGAGNWSVYQNGNFGYGGIAVGDVNNDGFKDAGYAMHHNYSSNDFGDQLIEVALGDGTGMNWIPWDEGLATSGETWGMFGTDFADVNNDGLLDIGSNSFGASAGVHVYLNQGDGTWTQGFGFIGGNSTMDFSFGDVNNDGNVDFAVNHQYGTVYFGDGTGNFVLSDGNLPGGGSMGRRGTSLGDVDNDGGKDLCFINGNGGVEVWIWDESENMWIDFSGNLPATGGYEATQLYDMNVDGFVDVCVFGSGNFQLWLGDGTGNWTPDAQFNTPSPGTSQAFRVGGDIDHNGYPDIALVAEEGSWISSQNFLHCFKESSQPDELTIIPMFPRGNEHFNRFSTQFIDWVSGVPNGESSYVKLEYSRFGNNGPWIVIADSLPNNGRYQWNIPRVTSSDCYIRYTVWTAMDTVISITPSAFSIGSTSPSVDDDTSANQKFFMQNSPNPFSTFTTISFNIHHRDTEDTEIKIYNIKGQLVRELGFNISDLGFGEAFWDGKNDNGKLVSSGIYFYKLTSGEKTIVKKMVLMR